MTAARTPRGRSRANRPALSGDPHSGLIPACPIDGCGAATDRIDRDHRRCPACGHVSRCKTTISDKGRRVRFTVK